MNVLQIVCTQPADADGKRGITGPEKRCVDLLDGWAELGISVTVCYPEGGRLIERVRNSRGVTHVDFEFTDKLDFVGCLELRRLCRVHAIDVIHCQGSPAVDLLSTVVARSLCVPIIVTRPSQILTQANHSTIRKYLYHWVDAMVTHTLVSRMVVVSRGGLTDLPFPLEVFRTKYVSIPNGVDTSAFSFGFTRNPDSSTWLIGMVGHLYAVKGWEDFIWTIHLLRQRGYNAKGLVVGEGEQREELEAIVSSLALQDHVEFSGFRGDIANVLAGLDIFLFTSKSEGLPVSVLEAMAAGVAVVSTNVGQVSEIVQDRITGRLVGVGDTRAMVDCCIELMTDPGSKAAMVQKAADLVRKKYTLESMRLGYASAYENVVR